MDSACSSLIEPFRITEWGEVHLSRLDLILLKSG